MVPDFQLEIPCPTGGKGSRLAELKVLHCCQTRCSPGNGDKAVDRRERLLQGEYNKKAREAYRKNGGIPGGTIGPVETSRD